MCAQFSKMNFGVQRLIGDSGVGIELSLVLASLGVLREICSRSKKAKELISDEADRFGSPCTDLYPPKVEFFRKVLEEVTL